MFRVCVIGIGHVGLVTGACLAELGNTVIGVDNDAEKIGKLRAGKMPFYEPGLEDMVRRNVSAGRLSFSDSIQDAVADSEIIFIAVGTPQKPNGEADLRYVEAVAREISRFARGNKIVVEKSTVPVSTGSWVKRTIGLTNSHDVHFDIASNPEFLREGAAIQDFMHPDRIVIGVENEETAGRLRELYSPLDCPVVITNIETAELIKHACNSFLALKISYINAIANLCEKVGADVNKVAEGMGHDKRIGRAFLNAGIGYGGSCFPKDVSAFIKISEAAGYDFQLLKAVQNLNDGQRAQVVRKAKSLLWNLGGKTIGLLGLAFRPDTDDIRNAPSLDIARQLQGEGARVKAYDPRAMENAKAELREVTFCTDVYDLAGGCDALVLVTEWSEFKEMDLSRVKSLLSQPIMIDGRNMFDPAEMKKAGFTYVGIGR